MPNRMMALSTNSIFSRVAPEAFFGRDAELDRVLSSSDSLTILAAPSAGASELLRQAYDRLFFGQKTIVPFFFELRPSDGDLRGVAARFVHEFLVQAVAFRRNDVSVIRRMPSLDELSRIAPPADGAWIDDAVEAFVTAHEIHGRAFLRTCLGIPARIAARGPQIRILLNAAHIAEQFAEGDTFFEDLHDLMRSVPCAIAGNRRALYGKLSSDAIRLDPLDAAASGRLCEELSQLNNVAINDQTRDLLGVQLDGNVGAIVSVFKAARDASADLDNFDQVERVYTDEIFGGRLGRSLDEAFRTAVPETKTRRSLVRALAESINADDAPIPKSYLRKHLQADAAQLEQFLIRLDSSELINNEAAHVRPVATHLVRDHIVATARLAKGERRALVVGDTLADNVRRAPQLMAEVYRKASGLDLPAILEAFDGQEVSTAAIDYRRFKLELKGVDDAAAVTTIASDKTTVTLPRIALASDSSAFDPRLLGLKGRAAIGSGTDAAGGRIVVLAAEIESKMEASRDTAEEWCDTLGMVAAHNDFEQYRIWLIAPEGFDDDAMNFLAARNAHGSSRKQAEILAELLGAKDNTVDKTAEYEIVLPMGDETEMISARTVEEIARRHGMSAKATNQVKTALVEACINATEHSRSPDGKIRQNFAVENGRLTITVSNRGLRLTDAEPVEKASDDERRGWGLQLIRTLMDDVRVERTDDGTRIVMSKNITAE